MAQDLYLFNFNNYYNRIVKKYNTLDEYLSEGDLIQTVAAVNFNPNDSVATSHVVNLDSLTPTPDYLLVLQDNIIISRWYVLEAKKTSYAQYQLTLLRDVVADWYDDIVNAPMYIEKGFVNINDPAIWNEEDIQVNQIKHAEHPLKDPTGCPWIVGYCARGSEELTITIPQEDIRVDYNGFENYAYHKYTNTDFIGELNQMTITMPIREPTETSPLFPKDKTPRAIYWNNRGESTAPMKGYSSNAKYYATRETSYIYDARDERWDVSQGSVVSSYDNLKKRLKESSTIDVIKNKSWNTIAYNSYWDYGEGETPASEAELATFLREDGRIIQADGKYYRINVTRSADATSIMAYKYTDHDALSDMVFSIYTEFKNQNIFSGAVGNPLYFLYLKAGAYRISYSEIPIQGVSVTLQGNHQKLNDAPYDMFCLPYGDIELQVPSAPETYKESSANMNMRIAQEIALKLGDKLYDLQLLPYCPLSRLAISDGAILTSQIPYDNGWTPITIVGETVETVVGYMYWCNSSTFSFNINRTIDVPIDAIDFKVANQCEMLRLVSPNYNGQFEFTATKNNGIPFFTIDCTCKPYSPYIKVAPYFGGLYGQDFDDARGLICGGDFSLPIVSDAWVQYQINNKNYANMFDRQVENLEFTQSQERTLGIVNAITGSVSGTATGAMAGAAAGPWGALAGGIVGGAASIAGGVVDYQMMEARHAEVIDYTKDQFNMSLQNIKAMPQSLSKVSAFNANNKIYPILEIYKATPVEEEAVRNKIRYNGMKIGRIGTLADMISLAPEGIHYYKGKVIRFGNIGEDYHVAVEISNELNRGVYIES